MTRKKKANADFWLKLAGLVLMAVRTAIELFRKT